MCKMEKVLLEAWGEAVGVGYEMAAAFLLFL